MNVENCHRSAMPPDGLNRYRLFFEKAGDAIYIHDREGRFLEVNSKACSSLGYSRGELLSMSIGDIDAKGHTCISTEALHSIAQRGYAVTDTVHRSRDGMEIPVEVVTSEITLRGQQLFISLARDMGNRKRAEQEILRWNRELAGLTATTTALIKINHLISSSFNIQQVWDTFTREVRKLIPFDRIGVMVFTGQDQMERMVFSGELAAMPAGIVPVLPGCSVAWVREHRVPLIQKDLGATRRFIDDDALLQEGIHSAIRVPIFARGVLIGVFFLESRTRNTYSEHNLTALEPIAVQLAITLENQRLYRQLQERERHATILFDLTATLNATLDLHQILKVLAEKTAQALQINSCLVALIGPDGELAERYGLHVPEHIIRLISIKSGEYVEGRAVTAKQPVVVEDLLESTLNQDSAVASRAGIASLMTVPIVLQGMVLGIINAYAHTRHHFTPAEQALLQSFAGQAAVAINNARNFAEVKRAKEKIEEMSQRDFLTGLFNRQFFEDQYQKEIERSIRYQRPLTVAMLDLDNLKPINDTYGHRMGDAVLAEVGAIVRQTIRQVDIAGRFGGDEIVVAFPETGIEDARRALERLEQALDRLNQEGKYPFFIGVSIGVASGCRDYRSLLQEADEAMYKDKFARRERGVKFMKRATSGEVADETGSHGKVNG